MGMPWPLALVVLLHSVPDAPVRTLERIAEEVAPSEVVDLAASDRAADALTLHISASFLWQELDGRQEQGWVVWATLAVRPEVWWHGHEEVAAPRACAALPRSLSPHLLGRALDALGCPEDAL